MRRWILLLPILHGCALNCTEMGCAGELTFYLQGQPTDGTWSVEVTLGTENNVCSLSYPDGEPVCSGPLNLSAGAEGMTAIWTTSMGSPSATGHIRVSHDGLLLVDEDFQPEWSEPYYPNGKACDQGMGCSSAELEFPLD